MKDKIASEINFIEGIRKRPAMYIGSTKLFGLINYFVYPVSMFLARGARSISVTISDQLQIATDAQMQIEEIDGLISPFQEIRSSPSGYDYEGTVLNALSRELHVSALTETQHEEIRFARGELVSRTSAKNTSHSVGTTLRFAPDDTIFTITQISSAVFESYLRRLSFLHRGVRFSLTIGTNQQEFFAANGIADLFQSITSPFQIMHEPIYIDAQEGKLRLQLAMAYQSWSDNHVWCFINNGRAVQGGTHEKGLLQGINRLKKELKLPEHFHNGVIAIASLHYPEAVWEGCIKAKIANPELYAMVSRLVVNGVVDWLKKHPSTLEHIQLLQTFQFPDVWYR